jgi:hypothetical protein
MARMTTADPHAGLRERLNETHRWPAAYVFKWVVPAALAPEIEALLVGAELSRRPSKNGRFVGITAKLTVPSADAVIALYQRVARFPGVVAL